MRANGRLRFEILAVGAFCALALWALIGVVVHQMRARAEEAASAMARNLSRTLAEYEDSSLRAIDLSLRELREHWQRDPATFGQAVARHEEHLQKEKVIQVAVIDRDAWAVYSRLPQPGRMNFADREYYQVQKTRGRDEMYISEPVMGRITGRWAIQVTRPLFDTGNQFAGVIIVAVPPPALEKVLEGIQLGHNGDIMVVRPDGALLARTGGLEPARGIRLEGWPGAAAESPADGDFRRVSAVDGIERFYAYRKLRDYPLTVYVGQEVGAALAPYRRERDVLIGFGALATVLLFAVALLLMARERERARFAEQRERLMLELHDGCIQSLYAIGLSLEGARRRVQSEPAQVESAIAHAGASLSLVIQDLRAFITAERRGPYSEREFLEEIERMLPPPAQSGPRFRLDIDRALIPSLAPREAAHLLRITREAISNIVRHARASSARVVLRRQRGRVHLEISDDGIGLGGARDELGMGLHHISARARELRGRAVFETVPNQGTRVAVEFPLRA